MPRHILLIEDRRVDAEAIVTWFEPIGWLVQVAGTSMEGVNLARGSLFAAVILDLGLEDDGAGFRALRWLRQIQQYYHTPIIVYSVTGHNEEHHVQAIRCGASYVLKKRATLLELETILRRYLEPPTGLDFGVARPILTPVDYDPQTNTVYLHGVPRRDIVLKGLQPRLMRLLAEQRGAICKRDMICEHVYDGDAVSDATIEQLVNRLRKSLGDKRYVRTEYGLGYRLPVER